VRKETSSLNGIQERERKTRALKYECEKPVALERDPKVQNLRPKKESKSTSMKGSAQECECASAKAKKSACPALATTFIISKLIHKKVYSICDKVYNFKV
jgi:hypothetical protein